MGTATAARLDAFARHVDERARWTIGYPCARTDGLIDWSQTDRLHRCVINNVGHPWDPDDRGFSPHARPFEREVLDRVAGWFGAPPGWQGLIGSGSSEAIGRGLKCSRLALPDAITYYSTAAHMAVPAAIDDLALPSVVVATHRDGTMDLDDLARKVDPTRPATVLATAGTTMTEAIDDVPGIHEVLDALDVRRYVHVDAALSGLPIAVSRSRGYRSIRMGPRGARSINLSTAKFLGTPDPGGILLADGELIEMLRRPVSYLHSRLATSSCSRSGHMVVQAWLALDTLDDAALHQLAQRCRRTARWLHGRLRTGGVSARRRPDSLTVYFPAPSDHLVVRYGLAVGNGIAHVVCVPGIDEDVLNEFVADMSASAARAHARMRVIDTGRPLGRNPSAVRPHETRQRYRVR
jgi:histidine decarboxylase